MKSCTRSCTSIVILAAAGLMCGCATIVKGDSQEISVTTEPAGAVCELTRGGQSVATINPTPGAVRVSKSKYDISLTCKKQGYVDATASVPSSFQGWTVGNVLIGGLIGVAIDAGSGAINQYEADVVVKLQPESFAGGDQRDAFFDDWRLRVIDETDRVKKETRQSCPASQCDSLLAKVDTEREAALAQIEEMRTHANVSESAKAALPVVVAIPKGARSSDVASLPDGARIKVGDRWQYRLSQRNRDIGTVSVEITTASGGKVRERITRNGYPAFVAHREVETTFSVIRFQPEVSLPGGYRLDELSPYFPADASLTVGQKWDAIPGEFKIAAIGSRVLMFEVRVVGQEPVRVPAGTFNSWRVEALSQYTQHQTTSVRIKCTYWFSPEVSRAVKMEIADDWEAQIASSGETYELSIFQPGE